MSHLSTTFNKNSKSDEELNKRLFDLTKRTGYPLQQENGQRIFGPPKNMSTPPKGSEIFIGKLPRFIYEDELVPLFEQVGPIYQLRLMMDFSGKNRGYGFVTYTNAQDAESAVATLNKFKIRNKYEICVYKSMDNCRLFVGGIPHEKSFVEVWSKLKEYVQGIVQVIMYPSNVVGEQNRGYVFVEFESHRTAAMARRQLGAGMSIMLWEMYSPVAVDWADPLPLVDPNVMNKVTKLYLRNLKLELSTGELQYYLTKHIPKELLSRVHKISDYAFIHFYYRDHAEYAFDVLNGILIDGQVVEVSWARPRCYSKANRLNLPIQNFCSSVPPKMRRKVEMQKLQLTPCTRCEVLSLCSCSSSSDSLTSSFANFGLSDNSSRFPPVSRYMS